MLTGQLFAFQFALVLGLQLLDLKFGGGFALRNLGVGLHLGLIGGVLGLHLLDFGAWLRVGGVLLGFGGELLKGGVDGALDAARLLEARDAELNHLHQHGGEFRGRLACRDGFTKEVGEGVQELDAILLVLVLVKLD